MSGWRHRQTWQQLYKKRIQFLRRLSVSRFLPPLDAPPKRRERRACKSNHSSLKGSCIYKRRYVEIKGITTWHNSSSSQRIENLQGGFEHGWCAQELCHCLIMHSHKQVQLTHLWQVPSSAVHGRHPHLSLPFSQVATGAERDCFLLPVVNFTARWLVLSKRHGCLSGGYVSPVHEPFSLL